MSAEPRFTPFSVNWTDVTAILSDALADTATVPPTVDPEEGAVRLTVGAVESDDVLLTVMVTGLDVVTLPAASRATARIVCVPLATLAEFQLRSKGLVRTSDPTAVPSTVNQTPATPELSDAVARRVTVPVAVPPVGFERLTAGGMESPAAVVAPLT